MSSNLRDLRDGIVNLLNKSASTDGYQSAYFDFGFKYFVAGRFAAAERVNPVAANLLHHAVTTFLLGGICTLTTEQEREKLGFDLKGIWDVFRARFNACDDLNRFSGVVAVLHEFEVIGLPEKMAQELAGSETLLDEIEAFIKAICRASGINKTKLPSPLSSNERHATTSGYFVASDASRQPPRYDFPAPAVRWLSNKAVQERVSNANESISPLKTRPANRTGQQ